MPSGLAALTALAVVLLALVAWHLWRRRPKPRMVECAACHKTLPVTKAVITHGRIDHHRDGAATTVAEYHRRCAPHGP